ncbi:MAG: cysteine desulfurase [Planctomycetaceae bacterium]|nr:cysteine desulfurase [Planctomycetaceae bacterium]
MKSIYLDHNATTPIDPRVVAAMQDCYARIGANAGSQHRAGRAARLALDDAREEIATLLGAEISSAADQFVVTSGGTEANNLGILGRALGDPGRMIISSLEHPSTIAAAGELAQRGWQIDWLAALESGSICLNHLEALLKKGQPPHLVSVMLANNETGVIQPIREVVQRCHAYGIPVHTDAVQVAGKSPIDFRELGVDSLSLAAHKFHGPAGVGGLLVRNGSQLRPILFGGSQQLGMRPGTEPVALVVGMLAALRLWSEESSERYERLESGRNRLESALCEDSSAVVNGTDPRLPHTLNISFCGLDRQAILMALDLAGVACSTGSACASGSSEPSPVLLAMGLDRERIESSLRLSLGATTQSEEIEEAAVRILKTIRHLRQSESPANSPSEPREIRPESV